MFTLELTQLRTIKDRRWNGGIFCSFITHWVTVIWRKFRATRIRLQLSWLHCPRPVTIVDWCYLTKLCSVSCVLFFAGLRHEILRSDKYISLDRAVLLLFLVEKPRANNEDWNTVEVKSRKKIQSVDNFSELRHHFPSLCFFIIVSVPLLCSCYRHHLSGCCANRFAWLAHEHALKWKMKNFPFSRSSLYSLCWCCTVVCCSSLFCFEQKQFSELFCLPPLNLSISLHTKCRHNSDFFLFSSLFVTFTCYRYSFFSLILLSALAYVLI